MFAHHASVLFPRMCECCDAQPSAITIDVPGDQAAPVQFCESCFQDVQDAARE